MAKKLNYKKRPRKQALRSQVRKKGSGKRQLGVIMFVVFVCCGAFLFWAYYAAQERNAEDARQRARYREREKGSREGVTDAGREPEPDQSTAQKTAETAPAPPDDADSDTAGASDEPEHETDDEPAEPGAPPSPEREDGRKEREQPAPAAAVRNNLKLVDSPPQNIRSYTSDIPPADFEDSEALRTHYTSLVDLFTQVLAAPQSRFSYTVEKADGSKVSGKLVRTFAAKLVLEQDYALITISVKDLTRDSIHRMLPEMTAHLGAVAELDRRKREAADISAADAPPPRYDPDRTSTPASLRPLVGEIGKWFAERHSAMRQRIAARLSGSKQGKHAILYVSLHRTFAENVPFGKAYGIVNKAWQEWAFRCLAASNVSQLTHAHVVFLVDDDIVGGSDPRNGALLWLRLKETGN